MTCFHFAKPHIGEFLRSQQAPDITFKRMLIGKIEKGISFIVRKITKSKTKFFSVENFNSAAQITFRYVKQHPSTPVVITVGTVFGISYLVVKLYNKDDTFRFMVDKESNIITAVGLTTATGLGFIFNKSKLLLNEKFSTIMTFAQLKLL